MALKFLSFLGTGVYKDTVYEWNGNTAKRTAYIQKAIVELFIKQQVHIDEVFIFLTEKARERNWENPQDQKRMLLKKDFEELQKQNNLLVTPVEIPLTNHSDTIWEMFEIIHDIIEEDDEVIFDITHSFRFQPMLALLILHYARATKNITVRGIFYGSFDPDNSEKICPIIDLTPFSDLQDWITNVYAFLHSGNTLALTKWIDEKDKSIRREEKRTTMDLKVLRKLTESWQALTSSLQTNRGPLLIGKAQEALSHLQEIQTMEVRPVFRPLNTLYKKIENQFIDMAKEDPIASGLAAIEWCEEHALIQQAYTMAKELMSTAICHNHGLNYKEMSSRKIADTAVSVSLKINDNQFTIEQVEDKIIRQVTEGLLKYPPLLSTLKIIQDYRNDINHAGWRANPLTEDKFHRQYENWYPVFKENILLYTSR